MPRDLRDVCVGPECSMRTAMAFIDQNGKGIVLVCDANRVLLGTVTDGDIRRALLVGANLDDKIELLLDPDRSGHHRRPVTAPLATEPDALLELMRSHGTRQIPLLDGEGRVEQLITLDELVPDHILPIEAVIVAGGFGTRLHPLTEEVPKPMLLVGEKPLLEHTLHQLKEVGIRRVHFTTHYKHDVIERYFGDGSSFGIEISYVKEKHPLGTAGSLGKVDNLEQPILVINGDIFTRVDFRAMFDFHCEHRASMTVAVREHRYQVPYGVVQSSGVRVTGISEKPMIRLLINAGIYIISPEVRKLIPESRRYDMTDLIDKLISENYTVITFPIREYWQDIGDPKDYERVFNDIQSGKV